MSDGSFRGKTAEQELYSAVLHTANQFLTNCKLFSIEVLQQENPTYEDVAKLMQRVVAILTLVMDEIDPMVGQKAGEYVGLMTKMGVAIRNGDSDTLSKLVDELDRKPFL